jgi:hypothetical protein
MMKSRMKRIGLDDRWGSMKKNQKRRFCGQGIDLNVPATNDSVLLHRLLEDFMHSMSYTPKIPSIHTKITPFDKYSY